MESATAKSGKKGTAPICSQNPPGRPGKWGLSLFFPNRGWHLVRIAVAGLLLTASSLKCWQLATEPVIGDSLLDSRWLLIATVEFEFFLATLLLANLWAKPTWATALACFGLFTCISVCKALSGYATCGCFGRLALSPWYTSGLDFAVMASLLRWRPRLVSPRPPGEGKGEGVRSTVTLIPRATAVLLTWLLIGVPAAFVMGSYSPTIVSDIADISGSEDQIVILSPESWIGKPFPLSAYVKDYPGELSSGLRPLREELTEGDWLVLLYHHDCPNCREAIAKYKRLARETATHTIPFHIALIEMPPYGDQKAVSLDAPYVQGQLSDKKEWFVAAPVFLRLTRGIVTAASEGKRL